MTRVGALPERIDLIRRDLSARDGRNNEAPADSVPFAALPARVDIRQEAEDITNRDQRVETATVIFPASWDGLDTKLVASDAIRFPAGAGNVFECIGDAIEARDHAGRLDHYELTARRIVG